MCLCLYFICTCICICICFCICLIVTSSACKFIVLPMIISYQPPISKTAEVEHLLKLQIYKNKTKKRSFWQKCLIDYIIFLKLLISKVGGIRTKVCGKYLLVSSDVMVWMSHSSEVVNVYLKSDVMNSITVLLGFFGFK